MFKKTNHVPFVKGKDWPIVLFEMAKDSGHFLSPRNHSLSPPIVSFFGGALVRHNLIRKVLSFLTSRFSVPSSDQTESQNGADSVSEKHQLLSGYIHSMRT